MINKPLSPYQRIMALDAFRGLTIIGMMLVNAQTESAYALLKHAPWNGCTIADLVFPFFLFIVGCSAALSLTRQAGSPQTLGILKRTVLLFLIGLLLNAFPAFHWDHLRFMGILQRIAICYCLGSFLYLYTNRKVMIVIFLAIVFGYWYFLLNIEQIKVANLIDNFLIPLNHLYLGGKVTEPEGLLSTLPALATTLLGFLAADLLLTSAWSKIKKCAFMIALGCLLLYIGYVWSLVYPFNKTLWTSSYVLWTGGLAFLTLAGLFILEDILGLTKVVLPLNVVGRNALFAFVFHVVLIKLLGFYDVLTPNGKSMNLRQALPELLFSGLSPANASLLFSLIFVLFNLAILYILYRKKIFIRL